jgi:hypothetical protein
VAVAALLAGCAHSNIGWNSSGSAAAGTSSVGGQISGSGSGNAALVLFGLTAMAIYGSETSREPAPELDASRRVNEQDCSKPIKDWSANLKCR